jgi:hypothetical protein
LGLRPLREESFHVVCGEFTDGAVIEQWRCHQPAAMLLTCPRLFEFREPRNVKLDLEKGDRCARFER